MIEVAAIDAGDRQRHAIFGRIRLVFSKNRKQSESPSNVVANAAVAKCQEHVA